MALKNPTNVYSDTSRESSIWKSYSAGRVLIYEPSATGWHKATVYVGGKARAGYIHSADVEEITNEQSALKGLSVADPTRVYSSAYRGSSTLKSYGQGRVLLYRTFSANWYEATVWLNGKQRKGYIHKDDVETAFETQERMKGVALKGPTNVYRYGSRGSVWKSYSEGSILVYDTFSPNWHEAYVYVGGVKRRGFIHISDVENAVKDQVTLSGIGTASPTGVYPKASTSTTPLKTYPAGKKLTYRTFTSGWYQATVYVDGRARTGYIKTDQTEQLLDHTQSADGRTLSDSRLYKLASDKSSVMVTVPKGYPVKLKTYTKNWFQATVNLNGRTYSGFIRAEQITTKDVVKTKSYSYTFDSFVDKQVKVDPKSDGAGKVPATREQVAYYSNPSNFPAGTAAYYQFLNLKSPAGLSAREINAKLLSGKGILEGEGQAFVDASISAGLNEAYLIAHTLHETGNGTSVLANGIPVDNKGNITRDAAGKITETAATIGKVYNMYGYGARDECPIDCGAKYAFDQNWFTPSAAIIGGAQQVGVNYIARGQDTLYKMRWNPDAPATHQYATHVRWAEIQANKIAQIYQEMSNFILEFEIPKYQNQPGDSTRPGDPKELTVKSSAFPANTEGKTTANVNIRTEPSTEKGSASVIRTVSAGTRVSVLETTGGWYKVKAGSDTGWMTSDYVELLNLIEATVTLNVRPDSNTAQPRIGQFAAGTQIAVALEEGGAMIRSNEWYQVYYNGKLAWVSGGPQGTSYVKVIK
ncbi:SH3 domain-containing protein [Bhargavaea cecembensis]|uniref:SH3 domain-containing protein n=1 Tax=Bhargavaea cecembensis TaxID=394098 RepID=UPI0018D2753F|nr:SH3 domain-containing protein [Bhargavaea cecembensis]